MSVLTLSCVEEKVKKQTNHKTQHSSIYVCSSLSGSGFMALQGCFFIADDNKHVEETKYLYSLS